MEGCKRLLYPAAIDVTSYRPEPAWNFADAIEKALRGHGVRDYAPATPVPVFDQRLTQRG